MSELSNETGRQIGVLLDRKGHVEYVMVGNAKKVEMPDFGRTRAATDRFRGLRCVHTHLQDEKLTQDDLTDLALLRLDLMSIIQVDRESGLPGLLYSAHLLPGVDTKNGSQDYEFLEPNIPSQLDVDFVSLSREIAVAIEKGRAGFLGGGFRHVWAFSTRSLRRRR